MKKCGSLLVFMLKTDLVNLVSTSIPDNSPWFNRPSVAVKNQVYSNGNVNFFDHDSFDTLLISEYNPNT